MPATKKPKWLVVDGCPVPYDIAAQVYMVTRRAGQTVSSAYRGTDAAATRILHAHGKRNQAEIHRDLPAISNPPGRSQHDLHTDDGRELPAWHCGIDSGQDTTAARNAVTAAGAHFGWSIEHPYDRGVELHHWAFRAFPKTRKRDLARVIYLRKTLSRK